jgi:hypothetical protein
MPYIAPELRQELDPHIDARRTVWRLRPKLRVMTAPSPAS